GERGRSLLAPDQRLARQGGAGGHGLPGDASRRHRLQLSRLRGPRPPYRTQYRPQHGSEPFLVAGRRPADGDRGPWRPHRLGPWPDRSGWPREKDTLLYPERTPRHGVLLSAPPADPDKAPWHFASVGEGHDDATWTQINRALRAVGYDDVISIEHEDPRYDG